jgi:hypothetical protein
MAYAQTPVTKVKEDVQRQITQLRVAWNFAGSAAGTAGGSAAAPNAAASAAPSASASSAALRAAAASTAGNAERSYFCYGYSADRKTQYLTPVAPLPASVAGTDATDYIGSVVQSAWTAYVHGELKQGPAAYAACAGGDQTARVQGSREQMVRTGPSGSAVTKEIDWRYTGATEEATKDLRTLRNTFSSAFRPNGTPPAAGRR